MSPELSVAGHLS